MKRLILVGLVLALIFLSTFFILTFTGVLTVDRIEGWLAAAHAVNSWVVAFVVIALLTADMFIAVPTLTVSLLAGYFLGFPYGFAAAVSGLLAAGTSGYVISRLYGPGLLTRIAKDAAQRDEMESVFGRYGVVVLAICRAMPILPEVSCCLAGATRMTFARFFTAFFLGTVPYAAIATWAGAQSSLNDPTPALLTAVALTLVLSGAWAVLIRRHRRSSRLPG